MSPHALLSKFLVTIATLLHFCDAADLLDCFDCRNITDLADCHAVKQCRTNEMCYTEGNQIGMGVTRFTMGCKEKELCRGIDQTPLLGRRRRQVNLVPPPLKGCLQCCSLHGCNKYLCPVRFSTAATPVDGNWSPWGPWEACSVSCGIGLQSRRRTCTNPAPSGSGRNCLGDAKDVNICNIPCTVAATTRAPFIPPITMVTSKVSIAPGACRDTIDCSQYYPPEACHGTYLPWAKAHCPKHCGFCSDPNQSPTPCVDNLPNCNEFQSDICTSLAFWQWRESHCRKFCKLC